MTAKTDVFETEMAKLAKNLVQQATLDATPVPEKIDAFKVLTAYYALRLKHKTGDDEDEEGFSFANAALDEQEHANGASVRTRSRRHS